MTDAPLNYGPWSPLCSRDERGKQLRCLAALAAAYCGSDHPIILTLRRAEVDPMQFTEAQLAFEALPALSRRKILTKFARVTWPPKTGDKP
jgi:hypothetical protein